MTRNAANQKEIRHETLSLREIVTNLEIPKSNVIFLLEEKKKRKEKKSNVIFLRHMPNIFKFIYILELISSQQIISI